MYIWNEKYKEWPSLDMMQADCASVQIYCLRIAQHSWVNTACSCAMFLGCGFFWRAHRPSMSQTCSKGDILKGLCHSGSAGTGIILLKQPQECKNGTNTSLSTSSQHLCPIHKEQSEESEDDALIEMQGYSSSSGVYVNKWDCPLTKTNQLEPHTECLDFLRD